MAARRSKRTIVTLQEVIDEVIQAGSDDEGSYSGDEYEEREGQNDLFDDVPLQQVKERKKTQKLMKKTTLMRTTHLMWVN